MVGETDDVLDGDVLIACAVVLARGESEGCPDVVAGIDLDLIAEEGGYITVFVLVAKFLEDDGGLLGLAVLGLDVDRVGLGDDFEKGFHDFFWGERAPGRSPGNGG